MCNQILFAWQIGPSSSTWSNAHVPVVPNVAIQAIGIFPCAKSSSIAAWSALPRNLCSLSAGNKRIGIAASNPFFSTQLLLWSLEYAINLPRMSLSLIFGFSVLTRRTVCSRAASSATNIASLADPWMTPPPGPSEQLRNCSGKFKNLPSQSMTITSNSVAAGLQIWKFRKDKVNWSVSTKRCCRAMDLPNWNWLCPSHPQSNRQRWMDMRFALDNMRGNWAIANAWFLALWPHSNLSLHRSSAPIVRVLLSESIYVDSRVPLMAIPVWNAKKVIFF